MVRATLAATALIASSFSPLTLPALNTSAAALPSPNVLLCTDNRKLGPDNGHYWGTPYILPVDYTETVTFSEPQYGEAGEYYVATQTIESEAVIQRCRVMNWTGRQTGKYQDVEVAPPASVTTVYNCQTPLTDEGAVLGYVECPLPAPGGSPDDRRPGKN